MQHLFSQPQHRPFQTLSTLALQTKKQQQLRVSCFVVVKPFACCVAIVASSSRRDQNGNLYRLSAGAGGSSSSSQDPDKTQTETECIRYGWNQSERRSLFHLMCSVQCIVVVVSVHSATAAGSTDSLSGGAALFGPVFASLWNFNRTKLAGQFRSGPTGRKAF